MPLVKARTIYERARIGGYAVGGFDAEHLDMVKAIVEAADEARSPVIVFLWEKEIECAGPGYLEAIIKKAADEVSVPVAIFLDHGMSLKACLTAVINGHSGVMIDYSHLPFIENISKTKEVVDICHLVDVMVEAELGTVPRSFESDESEYMQEKQLTDPDQAIEFINLTGVDALTIAIGEESGATSNLKLEFDILRDIRKKTDKFLIMHGGSGTSPEIVTKLSHEGINGIRFATELRISFFDEMERMRNELGRDFPDSRKILKPAREAVKKIVKERMQQMGSWGQACTDGLCPPIFNNSFETVKSQHRDLEVENIVNLVQQALLKRNLEK
jgi:ketose-bisphosphate aldolase